MRCVGVAVACLVAVVVTVVAAPGNSQRNPNLPTSLSPKGLTLNDLGNSSQVNTLTMVSHDGAKNYSHASEGEQSELHQQRMNVVGRSGGQDLSFTPAQIEALKKLLLPPEERVSNATVETEGKARSASEEVRWQCFLEWLNAHSYKSKRVQRICSKEEKDQKASVERKSAEKCMPLLLVVVPTLCKGTQSCVNLTESSVEELLHRYVVWERKKRRQEEADDAVIYIVVVLAFYSFGIVFMIANFVRQEQRELEETKMYKQYVKLARDRWLTTRGNMANKLALQALNTFNAIPQTTEENKITFV